MTCDGYKKFGVTESGPYEIDPDGFGIGDPPITVYCDFEQG